MQIYVFGNDRNLESNNLTSLQKDTFEDLTKLRHLSLGDNPLICDCHLVWLSRWLEKSSRSVSQAKCNSPYHLRDKNVEDVLESEFKCAGKQLAQTKIILLYCRILDIQ